MTKNDPKILVADDSAFMRRILIDILKERGKFSAFAEAGNGDETLQTYRSEHPDIILLDLIMPGKDGFEVLKELGGKAQRLGAKGFIIKPFDGKDVIAKIEALNA